jgi:hypothetical protein
MDLSVPWYQFRYSLHAPFRDLLTDCSARPRYLNTLAYRLKVWQEKVRDAQFCGPAYENWLPALSGENAGCSILRSSV